MVIGLMATARTRRVMGLAALGVLGASALGACGSSDPVNTWAAKVDGTVISADDLMSDVRATSDNPAFQQLLAQNQGSGDLLPAERGSSSASLTAGLLSQRIVTAVVAREADKLGVKVPATTPDLEDQVASSWGGPEVFKGFNQRFREWQLKSTALQSALVDQIAPADPTAQDVAAYIASHPKEMAAAAPVCSRHILVETRSQAEDLLRQLAGGADFAALAQAQSTDTGSGAQGGSLGCDSPTSFVAPFAAALQSAPVGEVVGPVETEFGFHVIEVTERQALSDADQAQLAERALAEANNAVLDEWFGDALRRSEIEVNPRFGSWKADRQGLYSVVPPQAQ